MKRHIVICAPIGQDAPLAAKVLASVGMDSLICRDTGELLLQLREGAGAALVVEEVVTGGALRAMAAYVASQPTWSDMPILLLTRNGADSLDVQRAVERLGNVTLLERPVRSIALITAGRSALRARERQYEVRDADQRKDEFLATLAHELRNPLAPIRTSMGILKHLHAESPQVTQVRGVVDRQVSHLTRLVDDLLDVARITSGKVVLKKNLITLHSVINHAVEISTSSMEAKKHAFVVEQPEEEFVLDADHARLVQSVANLLVNAAKFTPPGGRVVLRAAVNEGTVSFSVKDDGIGLEPSSLTRIFDLFAQTPVPGEPSTGLGIGLSLARQFAEMHGGTLSASSEGLGHGSEFLLSLPVVMAGAQARPSHAQPRRVPAVPSTRKILLVDDNVDAANTLDALLRLDGFSVTTVYDGMAAVESIHLSRPDVVVMDIGMPGMDGYDAARIIRRQPGNQDIVMIALTGWGQSADRQRAAQAGFDHHLVKPVDYDILAKCLDA